MTSPAPDVSPSIWTDYTYDSELDIAERRSLSVFDAARVPEGEPMVEIIYKEILIICFLILITL